MPIVLINFKEEPKGIEKIIGIHRAFEKQGCGIWERKSKSFGSIKIAYSRSCSEIPYSLTISAGSNAHFVEKIINTLAKEIHEIYHNSEIEWAPKKYKTTRCKN